MKTMTLLTLLFLSLSSFAYDVTIENNANSLKVITDQGEILSLSHEDKIYYFQGGTGVNNIDYITFSGKRDVFAESIQSLILPRSFVARAGGADGGD